MDLEDEGKSRRDGSYSIQRHGPGPKQLQVPIVSDCRAEKAQGGGGWGTWMVARLLLISNQWPESLI